MSWDMSEDRKITVEYDGETTEFDGNTTIKDALTQVARKYSLSRVDAYTVDSDKMIDPSEGENTLASLGENITIHKKANGAI